MEELQTEIAVAAKDADRKTGIFHAVYSVADHASTAWKAKKPGSVALGDCTEDSAAVLLGMSGGGQMSSGVRRVFDAPTIH